MPVAPPVATERLGPAVVVWLVEFVPVVALAAQRLAAGELASAAGLGAERLAVVGPV